MATEHDSITDPEIHEPKGASTASANEVYIADGAGSGSWNKIGEDQLVAAELYPLVETEIQSGGIDFDRDFWASVVILDVSTAQDIYVPVPVSTTFLGATLVLGGAIATDDDVVSFRNAANLEVGTAVDVLNAGSAAGDIYSFTATTNNVLTAPTYIKISTDGASTGTVPLYITLRFRRVAV
jgi:hypothetical protein